MSTSFSSIRKFRTVRLTFLNIVRTVCQYSLVHSNANMRRQSSRLQNKRQPVPPTPKPTKKKLPEGEYFLLLIECYNSVLKSESKLKLYKESVQVLYEKM